MDFADQGHAIDYRDVQRDRAELTNMLRHSGGKRMVPVIVDAEGKVTIGYGGS